MRCIFILRLILHNPSIIRMTPLFLLILVIIVLLVVYIYRNIYRNSNSSEAFEDYFKSENEYKNKVKLLTDKYSRCALQN